MDYKQVKELYPEFSARFSNYLLRLLNENAEDDRNITVSPSRLQAVLVLLANWSTPTIRKHILELVGSDVIDIKEANSLCSKTILDLVPYEQSYLDEGYVPKIDLQTLLWKDKQLDVISEALAKVSDDYAITMKDVDFSDPGLKAIIDKTIEEATHGLIKQLDLKLTPDTIAIITDILYFKAMWNEPFEECDTKEQLFHGTKGKAKVPMMKRTGTMEYRETYNCQMVRMRYECMTKDQKSFSMRIYLPKPKHCFEEVLHEIWDHEFCLDMEYEEVKLSLPRFSVESSIDMNRTLADMGLSCIFGSKNIIPGCIKDLKIEQIIQQTKVVVDESGTEAAAVTSVGMCLGCCPMEKPKPIIMTVNRPFIFEIAEDSTNTILFTGIINNID